MECVREGNKTIRQARTAFGGQVHATPMVTYVLIAINVLAYLAELARPDIVDRFGSLGQGLISAHKNHAGGGYFLYDGIWHPGFEAVGVAHGEWYRLITSPFLHLLPTHGIFGITHIIFNMLWLWTLGPVVEAVLGRLRFLTLYLLSALGGSVMGYLIAPADNAVGASGAIFGLAAAFFVISRRLNRDPARASRLMLFFLLWMVVSAGVTSWEGHLGGLLAGGGITLAYAYAPKNKRAIVHIGASVGVLALMVALVVLKTSQLGGTL